MAAQKLIVVSHTHWDREWYLPFQVFRIKLVELMDELLDLLREDGGLRFFTLDGQTIALEDYLAVRPERAAEVREHVSGGRLLVGPWYVLPDEFLVSAESLIRNLLRGHRVAAEFGDVMKVGYLPDPFGHIAQMPQILRGFGIDAAVVWRGVGEDVRHTEFTWRAPDGSEVLAEYLPEGYDNAVAMPTEPAPLLELLEHARQVLGTRSQTDCLLLMNGDDHVMPQRNVDKAIEVANAHLKSARVVAGTLPYFFAEVRRAAADRGVVFDVVEGELRSPRHAHLLAGVLSTRMWLKQRNAACQTLLERWAEPFSAYARLLAADGDRRALLRLAWKHLLENQPHDSITGCSIDQVHDEMRTRYDWVDQIGGAVVERALAALARRVNTQAVLVPAGYERLPSGSMSSSLVVFNAESGPRTDFVAATVHMPSSLDDVAVADQNGHLLPCQILRERRVEEYTRTVSRGQLRGLLRLAGLDRDWTPERVRALHRMIAVMAGSKLPNLIVEDVAIKPGVEPDTVLIEARTSATGDHNYEALAEALREVSALLARGDIEFIHLRALRREEVEVGFTARDVPANGYRTYQLLPGHRHGLRPTLPPAGDTIENEYFSVRASREDGTLSVIDKETGALLTGLNAFVDGGDAGDEYTYSPPPTDLLIEGPSGPASVEVREDGPARSSLRVSFVLALPVALSDDRSARSAEVVHCPVVCEVALYAGVRRVDIKTSVTNYARDHRLRVLFPTKVMADHTHAEGQYSVVARPVATPPGGEGWVERPTGTYPQLTFVDVSDGEIGFAVANRGLPEYEALASDEGVTLALTLLRCVGWLSRDDLATRRGAAGPSLPTPGAQMIGTHVFEYALIPHAGDWQRVFSEAHWFANPLRAVATDLHAGTLPLGESFLGVEPAGLVVAAVKEAEDGDGIIVRVYNPGAAHALARVDVHLPVARAELVSLNEEHLTTLQIEGGSVAFTARAAQVVSLRLSQQA